MARAPAPPPALPVPTPAVILDFDLGLTVAMLVPEEPMAVAVLEMIIPVVMPAMVIEEYAVAAMPAMTGVVEEVIRAASASATIVPTPAGAAATTLGQQDRPIIRRFNLRRCDTGGAKTDRQQQDQCC